MEVERVQKWVLSALLCTTAAIFSCGLALLSGSASASRGAPQGLLVIAAVIGLAAIVGVRLIHSKSVLTPWLLLGLAPATLGWYFVFGR